MMDPKPIIDLAAAVGEPKIVPITPHSSADETPQLALLPAGKSIVDLTPYLDAARAAPRRIETTAKMRTVGSLIDYANRFKTPDSALFARDADPQSPSLLTVIDYHGQGAEAAPRFGRHRATYSFPVSDQIRAWSAISGNGLDHADMATFIAEHQHDIANPPLDWMQVAPDTLALVLHLLNIGDDAGEIDDGAADQPADDDGDERYVPRSALYKLRRIRFGSAQRLIQLARNIEVLVNAKAVEGYNPKTGERTVTFQEEHETRDGSGRKVSVPDGFLLRAPVFEGETPTLIPVQLQYRRARGGGVKWFMTLVAWHRVIRWAVKVEAERVQKATGLPLIYGEP